MYIVTVKASGVHWTLGHDEEIGLGWFEIGGTASWLKQRSEDAALWTQ